MSEYQYYEWQTIDRPLTSQERAAVNKLSSHITVSATGAQVDYSWGNFKHDPKQVLAKYFDAFLYLANWGSRHLMFRFPKAALDPWPLQPYIVEPYIALDTVGDYFVLAFQLNEDEPDDWIEGSDELGGLCGLRSEILNGDYRVLYLAWLHAIGMENLYEFAVDEDEIAEDEPEPPVPAGLSQLTASQQAFVDFFNIDEDLIAVAAQASEEPQAKPEENFHAALTQLTRQECEAFLLRLLKDEPHLSVALRRRLQEFGTRDSEAAAPGRRRVAELLTAREEWAQEVQRQREEAEHRRWLQELDALAAREPETWREVDRLIQTRQPKAYDDATQRLVKLRELAQHRNTQAAFQDQINSLVERYRRRSGLIDRLKKSSLI